MQKAIHVLAAAAVLAALAMPASAISKPATKDNLAAGTWKLNLEESIAPQGRSFHPYTLTIRKTGEVLDFTYVGQTESGEPFEFSYNGKADGVVRDLGSGLKGSMTRLPSGNYAAKLWMPDGPVEEKYCQLDETGNKDVCLATLTYKDGRVAFFKQVVDRTSAPVTASDIKAPPESRLAIGTWKLNLEESIAPQGRTFHPYTVTLRQSGEVLDFTYVGQTEGGEPFEFSYNGKADGVVRDLGNGLKGSMTRLPSGNYAAKLWMPDGPVEEKYCQLDATGNKNVCLATLTYKDGSVAFFRQISDRVTGE